MKRLRSSDDLASDGEKGLGKDRGRREADSGLHQSSSHRSFRYKSESGRKAISSSYSRYDRLEDDRESFRLVKKRSDYDADSYKRRKSYDRYRDATDRVVTGSSPRGGYGVDRIYRSESFSMPRRGFPKGVRSERDRSRREGSVSSWRRFGGGKDDDEGTRSGSESVKVSKMESDDFRKVKSPQRHRDVKSPPWSKDSGSEQSKSVECKKSEDLPMESGAHSGEMEEGELEPDPLPVPATEPLSQEQPSIELELPQKKLKGDHQSESKLSEDKENSLAAETVDHKEQVEVLSENVHEVGKEGNDLPDSQNHSTPVSGGSKTGTETRADDGEGKCDEYAKENSNCQERVNGAYAEKASVSAAETREDKGLDLADKVDSICLPILSKEINGETGAPVAVSSPETEEINPNLKDKGKGVVISPSNGLVSVEEELTIETEQRGLTGNQDADLEGPGTLGLELFTTHPVNKPEKAEQKSGDKSKDEKLALELSLSLPNVLLPIGSSNFMQAPGSPSRAKSSQSFRSSFRTNSDGFTTSFSGSQNFTHNPSCSLTHNSFDNCEKSVGSRPIFQGVDWQGLSSKENKAKEGPKCQNMVSDVNNLHQQSQASDGGSRGHHVVQQCRVMEGSSRIPVSREWQLSYSKQLAGVHSWHTNDAKSPLHGVGSHETRSEYTKEKKCPIRENSGGTLFRINSSDGKEQLSTVGVDFAESIITMIVSEPLNAMARRFSDMTKHQLAYVKESTRDIILNPGKQWQLSALQKALRNRADITLEMLLKSHRTQLEILVALKTGLQEFLQQNYEISSSDLAEIFLNIKCRNLACRNLLPVDECDCKICIQKNGFCSACMCLVCLKFDMASNTCSWVGCDVCLHWCHADCGLQKLYIRNGRSATGAEGTTEMQFHCVACNHPSEMFGFVKEVFQNFAREWTAETLSKELEYVRRIFSASQDVRGKHLHKIAIQMQSKLANKADLREVQDLIMGFFTDAESFRSSNTPIASREELATSYHDGINGGARSSQGVEWLKSVSSDKTHQSEKSGRFFPALDFNHNEKQLVKSNKQTSIQKEPAFDELETIMRIKHAEAKMFQNRADDARREAEALKRIAITKNERIEEEYTSRITKLHLNGAEELRKQKWEELQAVERAYQEYFNMKIRMESDIKDLLLKMEATRRNLRM